MSYFGPDPGNVVFCQVCGYEIWPFPSGDHKSCDEILDQRDRAAELAFLNRERARAIASQDPGYQEIDLPF